MRSGGWDGREENGEPGLHSIIFLTARLVPRDEGRSVSVGLICPFFPPGLILLRPRVVRLPAPMGTTTQPPQQGVAEGIGTACLGRESIIVRLGTTDNVWVH